MHTLTCEYCGEKFDCKRVSPRGRPRRFCSRECWEEYHRDRLIECVCEYCGQSFTRRPSDVFYHKNRFCSNGCRGRAMAGNKNQCYGKFGEEHPAYKGGTRIDPKGYERIYVNGKEHLYHRYVFEESSASTLDPEEVIHHEDGDRLNNEISNLRWYRTRGDHRRYHAGSGQPGATIEEYMEARNG